MTEKETYEHPVGLKESAAAIDAKKAEALTLLDVAEVSSITDYFLIATGTSAPHLRALARAVGEALDRLDVDYYISGGEESGWVAVDAFDFIVHIFTPEMRGRYALEQLWKDAQRVEIGLEPSLG